MDAANDLIEKYKKHPFAKGLLPFRPTIKLLDTDFAKIFAKQEGRQRWVICNKATGEPAIFSHAGVFAQGDPVETGNFVPVDEDIPAGLEEKNVQRRANSKCFYTYVLDTYNDISLYEGQWILDDYMSTLEGFNPGSLPRRPYLSGQDARYRTRFWMQTPVFVRTSPRSEESDEAPHLHPWVLKAARESKGFKANPDRPRVWVKEGRKVMTIAERNPGCLVRGDVMAFSFTISYHITGSNWFPQVHPADFVVMKSGDGDATDYSAPEIGLCNRPAPRMDDDEESDGSERDTDGPVASSSAGGGHVSAMEDVVEAEKPSKGPVGAQESMEVDDADVERRSSDTLGSSGEARPVGPDGFEMLSKVVEGPEDVFEGFVDVMAREVEGAVGRGGSGKAVRSRRRV